MFWCSRTASVIWSPIRITGLSEVIGSWKIIDIRLPRMPRIVSSSSAEQVGAFQRDGAADDLAGRVRHQPHDGERGHALAAAGFADDRQRLAAADVERDVVDRLEQPGIGEEHCFQVLHVEDQIVRLGLAHQPRCLGSRMSRSASPNRLVPNTARLIATPGKMTSHGAVRTYSAADSDSMRPQDG